MTIRAPEQMACREFVELVTEFLEGTLPLNDRTRFEHHLVFCTWCVDYLQQMRDTLRLSGRLTERDLPSEGKDELLRAFRDWKRGLP
jgi:Putative zinc-finger